MGWVARGAVLAAAAGGGVVATRVLKARRASNAPAGGGSGGTKQRWHTLTVNLPPDEVAPGGRLPDPLADLGDTVEVRIRPAPADKGTEIAVRLRAGEPDAGITSRLTGDDPRWAVRRALRETRSLLETGEVLLPSGPPTTRRTLRSRPLEYATRHGREEGLL
jgi:hypothetical protein